MIEFVLGYVMCKNYMFLLVTSERRGHNLFVVKCRTKTKPTKAWQKSSKPQTLFAIADRLED